jgi:peptidoglycan/xylan/chitin deacetylase (PgdA/CDA1 family)
VSIEEVVVALACGSVRTLPPRPLLITFDDGHAGNAELFPIFHRYKIPVVIYAVAGLIGTRRQFWFDLVPHHSTAMVWLKALPDNKRRDLMRNDYGHWDERDYDRPVALSTEHLQAFVRMGGTVGSHTMFHPMLNRCDPETGRWECSASRALLEEIVGVPVHHFALPNGQGNERVLNWVRDAGYRSCRSIRPGRVKSQTSLFDLPNFGISDDADVPKAAVQACGLWDLVKRYVRNRSNSI